MGCNAFRQRHSKTLCCRCLCLICPHALSALALGMSRCLTVRVLGEAAPQQGPVAAESLPKHLLPACFWPQVAIHTHTTTLPWDR